MILKKPIIAELVPLSLSMAPTTSDCTISAVAGNLPALKHLLNL
jgi:hypothetical protein